MYVGSELLPAGTCVELDAVGLSWLSGRKEVHRQLKIRGDTQSLNTELIPRAARVKNKLIYYTLHCVDLCNSNTITKLKRLGLSFTIELFFRYTTAI